MMFGLKNALWTFHRVMDVILAIQKWQFALAYLDYLIISKLLSEHVEEVRKVLHLLSDAVIKLNHKKFSLFTNDTLDYFGPIICPGKMEIAMHTSDAIGELRKPRHVTELRYVIRLRNTFRPLFCTLLVLLTP